MLNRGWKREMWVVVVQILLVRVSIVSSQLQIDVRENGRTDWTRVYIEIDQDEPDDPTFQFIEYLILQSGIRERQPPRQVYLVVTVE
jgi:hypothetical protein